jgi:hypothetical protein
MAICEERGPKISMGDIVRPCLNRRERERERERGQNCKEMNV